MSATDHKFVYTDAVIFQARGKLTLFKQQSWSEEDLQKYSDDCRQRYIDEYESRGSSPNPQIGQKRPHSAIDDEEDEYEKALQSLAGQATNEYDRYIHSPILKYKIDELDYWRDASNLEFQQLSMMVRNTLAVPGTGAGVEREFSVSVRVATAVRCRLSPEAI